MPKLSAKGERGRRASQAESTAKDLPVLSFATARAWSEWLATHHASARGLWLKIAKKGSGSASVTYPEALDPVLAWGWIDGQKGTFNDVWWLQRFTPRTAKSPWSKIGFPLGSWLPANRSCADRRSYLQDISTTGFEPATPTSRT